MIIRKEQPDGSIKQLPDLETFDLRSDSVPYHDGPIA